MASGKVKWFNNAKGYGFIRPDSGGDDLFVHYSYICMEGYKSLKAGQSVTYDVREAPKGLHAVNIGIAEEELNASEASAETTIQLEPENCDTFGAEAVSLHKETA